VQCFYDQIDKQYLPECKYIFIRMAAAFFSAQSPTLVYLITKNLGGSVWTALLAASFLMFDNLNVCASLYFCTLRYSLSPAFLQLTEGRLILVDSQLMFWILAAIWVAQVPALANDLPCLPLCV
jgi:dolichyl-phosphate-mannose--protein O-mannosyl transferase